MENLRGDPGIEAAYREGERPIALQQAIRQRAGAGGRAGGFFRRVRKRSWIELRDIFPLHRADLQAALRDDGKHAGFARGIE